MTLRDPYSQLGRRERQIMSVVYELGRASVSEVRNRLPDPPSYSAVRAMLGLLEKKEYLRHVQEGARYIYLPKQPRSKAIAPALRHMVRTFFQGSVSAAMAALVELAEDQLTEEDVERVSAIVEAARRRTRS